MQVAYSKGVSGLGCGFSGEPPSAAEDQAVGVLLEASEVCVNGVLVGGRGEPEGREGFAHELALGKGDAPPAAVWHWARV